MVIKVMSNDRDTHFGRTKSTGPGHLPVTQREAVVSPTKDY